MGARPSRAAGFTLLEILATVLISTFVILAAISGYVNTTRQSERITALMRDRLTALAVLDRVAREIEGAVLIVKPPELDPISHPWFFRAESNSLDGADRLRFVSRGRRSAGLEGPSSDVSEIAFFVESGEDDTVNLYQWVSPTAPTSTSFDYPDSGDEASLVLATGVRAFGFRFLDREGEWIDEWDSTSPAQGNELPAQVEIRLVMPPVDDLIETDGYDDGYDDEAGTLYVRRVVLPQRPFDLAKALTGTGDEQDASDCSGGLTLAGCIALDSEWHTQLLDSATCPEDAVCEALSADMDTCWSDFRVTYSDVAQRASPQCNEIAGSADTIGEGAQTRPPTTGGGETP